MNKIVKKTMAAAMALTLVAGAAPFAGSGFDVMKPAIVANAEGTLIATGNQYYTGDTIDFGSDDVYVKILNSVENYADRTFTLDENFELSGDYYTIKNADDDSDMILLSAAGLSDTPVGLKVYGKGTSTNPYTFKAIMIEKTVNISNVNIALDDSITLRFYSPVESFDGSEVDKVILSGPNDPIEITSFEKDATGAYYVFSYPLYATQLGKDVTIQFKNGSTVVKVKRESDINKSFSYKVNDYCDYVLSDTNHIFDEKTVNAVKSLKNLGIAADNYFDGTSTAITFLDSDYSSLEDFGERLKDEKAKFSLVLDSKLSVRTYIDGLTAGEQSQDDGYDDCKVYTAISGKGDKACFEWANINPTDLDGLHYFMYKDDDYYLAPLFYCARAVYNNTNSKAVDVAKAVYEYNKYIEKYANIIKIRELEEPDYLFAAYEFSFTPGMTWSQLAEQDESLLSDDKRVYLDYDSDEYGYNYICDDEGEDIDPKAEIDPSITYYFNWRYTD